MSKKSQNSSNDLLKTVGGIAAILIVFVVILRAALDPLYQEVGQLEARQNQASQMNAGGSTQQSDNGGGGNGGGGENVSVNIGGLGGIFNWALGWAWGGPGWYSGPDYGWWGANVWNGWSNRWNGGGWNGNNNRVWDGTVNENNTRNFNDTHSNQDIRNDGGRDSRREDQNGGREFRNDGGRNQESHGGGHEGGGGDHGRR
jgi:hypothetical protein